LGLGSVHKYNCVKTASAPSQAGALGESPARAVAHRTTRYEFEFAERRYEAVDPAIGCPLSRPPELLRRHADLADTQCFAAYLSPLRKVEWVVYSRRPFGGPEAVLAHLSGYTHRVAIANRRHLQFNISLLGDVVLIALSEDAKLASSASAMSGTGGDRQTFFLVG
jgi:hypothetical protein